MKKFYILLTLDICVLYDLTRNSDFYLTNLADWFCIAEVESVYSAVRIESLYKTDTFSLQRYQPSAFRVP